MNNIYFLYGKWFNRLSILTIFFAFIVIWWGVTTTSTNSGMIFPDWPLSNGSINPDGWLSNLAPFLEHSHRLFATCTGFLVLFLFIWAHLKSGTSLGEIIFSITFLVLNIASFIISGAERGDEGVKSKFLIIGIFMGIVYIIISIYRSIYKKWNLLQNLTLISLLFVSLQAVLGGLRVTEVSDILGALHGVIGQLFFCSLILIYLISSKKWGDNYEVNNVKKITFNSKLVTVISFLLFSLISIQLVLGSFMRHLHRQGLVDNDLFKTAGKWIPDFNEPIIIFLFFHKLVAVIIFTYLLCLFVSIKINKIMVPSNVKNKIFIVFYFVLLQICLGLLVIFTGKQFWILNLHVLGGLVTLATSFIILINSFSDKFIKLSFLSSKKIN